LERRARSLFAGCVLLLGCRRGALSGDGGAGMIDPGGRDATIGDGSPGSDASGGDAPPGNAAWSAWPLPNHDPASTRRSPFVGPQAPVDRLALDASAAAMVIGTDGTLYATGWGDTHPIVAVDPATGAQRWSFTPEPSVPTTVNPFSPSIAAGPEGNIYVAYHQGAFYALDRDGFVRWQYTTGKTGQSGDLSTFSAPMVDAGGRVYVGEASVIYAFESDGRSAWQYDTRALPGAAPAGIAADGTVYVTESYGALHALGRDGAQLWTAPSTAATPAFSGLMVREDGTLLFAYLGDRQFGALDDAGNLLWRRSGQFAGFALGSDGAPYGADGTGLLRLARDGSTVWQAAAGGSGAIVDAAGTVYSAAQGSIAAVGADGVLKWELRTADPAVPASALWVPVLYAIGGDGTLYASIKGTIHAIGGGGPCEGNPVDCDDHNPCTVDRCDPQAGCVHAPKCVSSSLCTGAGCGLDGTCTFASAVDGIACDDGIACSEGDSCRNGQCTAGSSACAPAGAWPAAAHDAQHTHATTLLGPAAPTPKWTSPVPGVSTFVIADDGTILATDGQQVETISPDGAVAPLAAVPAFDLALRQDGGIYAMTREPANVLRSLGADGTPRWAFDTTPLSPPAIGPSGVVYAMTRTGLVALTPDGATLWKVPTGGGFASPAVGPDGTAYALCPDLWAIAPDGRVNCTRPVGWGANLVVGPAGTTYVIVDSAVRAIDASGADVWTWSPGAYAAFAPALSPGGDLILIAGNTIYRLDAATGALRSMLTPPMPAQYTQQLTAPIVDGNDVLYVIANTTDNTFQPQTQATVYAIDRSDRTIWTAAFPRGTGASGGALAIGPGRTLYVTIRNALQAIGP
jgi:hypothetical protein